MPCDHIDLGNGNFAIVCRTGGRAKICAVCGKRRSSKLCDYELRGEKKGKTCDRPLCEKCAVHEAPDKDWCPTHAQIVEKERAAQGGLFRE